MSGKIQWSSKAKRKPLAKRAGSKINAQRQRIAARKRRMARDRANLVQKQERRIFLSALSSNLEVAGE